MKLFKNAAILLFILLGLIGANLYMNRDKAADSGIYVYKLEESLSTIRLTSNGGNIVFEKSQGNWKMSDPTSYRIVEDLAARMEGYLSKPKAIRLIEKDAKDLSVYGLDDPVGTVTIISESGRKRPYLSVMRPPLNTNIT